MSAPIFILSKDANNSELISDSPYYGLICRFNHLLKAQTCLVKLSEISAMDGKSLDKFSHPICEFNLENQFHKLVICVNHYSCQIHLHDLGIFSLFSSVKATIHLMCETMNSTVVKLKSQAILN